MCVCQTLDSRDTPLAHTPLTLDAGTDAPRHDERTQCGCPIHDRCLPAFSDLKRRGFALTSAPWSVLAPERVGHFYMKRELD